MGAIANGLSLIINKIVGSLAWIGKLFVAVFVAFWDLIRDAFAWVLEELLKLSASAIGAIDVSGLSSLSSAWSGLPAEIWNILSLIGFGYCMGIVGSAIAIRLALQLIPFTRLGS
jgi:hypothetical protein